MERAHTPTEKGNIAELMIAAKAVQARIAVARPVNEGLRYDLIFDTDDRLFRVQCKWASLCDGFVRVAIRTSRHSPVRGYLMTTYSTSEVDLIAAYCQERDTVYVLPIAEFAGRSVVHLRLKPTRNNQSTFVRWARDYELGAIAQLGERDAGSVEVEGSSPSGSTKPKAA